MEMADAANIVWSLRDGAGLECDRKNIDDDFSPYTVYLSKPQEDGKYYILTNSAFAAALHEAEPISAAIWKIARLRHPIVTYGRLFCNWGATENFTSGEAMKNPRNLVKESSNHRQVVSDIRPWILRSEFASLTCDSSAVWMQAAFPVCIRCLPDELEMEGQALKFKGPPKMTVDISPNGKFNVEHFEPIQKAINWIYELDNQADIRHQYFKSEIVRSGLGSRPATPEFLDGIIGALDGARIAYALSISELGKDTIKALADLKKSVGEDTSKLTESTRQTIAAVAAALAVGFGLLAARVSANAPISLIMVIMLVACFYVVSIVLSGFGLIHLQRQVRQDWHTKIYRFLTDSDYHSLVVKPSKIAEKMFHWAAALGGGIVLAITFYIFYLWYDT
jgi:hypothetical protein